MNIVKWLADVLLSGLLAVPVMFFMAFIDPVRGAVGLQSYSISFLSILGTILLFRFYYFKSHSDQLMSMRGDGLSESRIEEIVGLDTYNVMLDAFERTHGTKRAGKR